VGLPKMARGRGLHGYESGRTVRRPGGEFIEVHQPVDVYDRWKLIDYETYQPLVVRPNAKGRIPWHENLRSSVSRWLFEDRLQPLTQAQIEEADAHQQHTLAHDAEIETAEILESHARAGVTSEDQLAPVDETVGETPNTPSSVIAQEPADKRKKKSESEDGE